jgi:hypothetical protein
MTPGWTFIPMRAAEVLMDDRLSLRPTPEQYRAFCDHLCQAHSWYKHLPLLTGERFVVFVAADAGIGRLVLVPVPDGPNRVADFTLVTAPEGPEFTDKYPRLHHTWQTTREYRRRFGYLDYMCGGGSGKQRDRDAGPPLQLPRRLEDRCSFVLYPYVSRLFHRSLYGRHDEAIERLRAGAAHPARQELLELVQLREAMFAARGAEPGRLSERYWQVINALRDREVEKIHRALAELDDWLLDSGNDGEP